MKLLKKKTRGVVVLWLCVSVWSVVSIWRLLEIESDPKKIWVASSSAALAEERLFAAEFDGGFFRIEQVIFTSFEKEDLINRNQLVEMWGVVEQIRRKRTSANTTLRDFCFQPIRASRKCLVESPLQLWRNDLQLLRQDPDLKLTTACQTSFGPLQQHALCTDDNGIPVIRNVVFGGLQPDPNHPNPDVCGEQTPKASALIATFLLNNRPEQRQQYRQWEKQVFLKVLADYARKKSSLTARQAATPDHMQLSYLAQRSISDALNVEFSQNVFIVIVSYVCMFLYISFALGRPTNPRTNNKWCMGTRIRLGIMGILIVISSLTISLGIVATLNIKVTMIVVEVVPFLILAIGVDNMFILTQAFDRIQAEKKNDIINVGEIMTCTMKEVGPSICVASCCETLAFSMGAMTAIPALQGFCLVAALAVFIDFLLQISLFNMMLILDHKSFLRQNGRNITQSDDFCISSITTPSDVTTDAIVDEDIDDNYLLIETKVESKQTAEVEKGIVERFISNYFVHWLFKKPVQMAILFMYACLWIVSGFGIYNFQLGLDQKLAMPTDFYPYRYFQDQQRYGEAGPPAYFVLGEGISYHNLETQQKLDRFLRQMAVFGSKPTSTNAKSTFIEGPIYSWLNTFNQWRQMRYVLKKLQSDCPKQPLLPFPYEVEGNQSTVNTTSTKLFYPLVATFTQISINSQCCQQLGFCGAQFATDIKFKYSSVNKTINGIEASRLRFQLGKLNTQTLFINSYYYLKTFTNKWAKGLPIFPYSLYFIYYEQYLYIQGVALQNLTLALGVVFLCSLFLLPLKICLCVVWCIFSSCCQLVGLLHLWNIAGNPDEIVCINAVSVVNLIMSIGLTVEFCIHIAYSFVQSHCTNVREAVQAALNKSGAAIVNGITLTKLCGIWILAFAPSKLYQLYFFRMYLLIILVGAFHGLVILPLLMSFVTSKKSTNKLAEAAEPLIPQTTEEVDM